MKLSILRILSAILILFFLLSETFQAQETKTFSEAQGAPAAKNKVYDYEKWSFSINRDKYEVNKSGRGKRIRGNRNEQNFHFSIEDAHYIDRVIYFAEYKNDLLLIGELSFDDAGGGFIVRLDGKTLKTCWRTSIPTFNINKGLIEEKAAYLAGVGFISKINLETGRYIWKHNDLYRKYDESGAFNIFLTPQIKGELVIFKEDDILNRGFDHQIYVDKSSGKIIKVLLN